MYKYSKAETEPGIDDDGMFVCVYLHIYANENILLHRSENINSRPKKCHFES